MTSPKAPIFAPDHLAALLADTLPIDAPPGVHLVVGTVDQQGAQIQAVFRRTARTGLRWELQTAAHVEWSGDRSAEAKILLRW